MLTACEPNRRKVGFNWLAALDFNMWSSDSPPLLKLPERILASVRRGFLERHRVHTVAQAAGSGTIGKDVAEMRVARVADSFNPFQKGRSVEAIRNYAGRHWLGK